MIQKAKPGLVLGGLLMLSACGMVPVGTPSAPEHRASARTEPSRQASDKAGEIVLFALGLLETGYRFGGKNPEAGLDCSGMVSYVFRRAANLRLTGSAADLAQRGRPVDRAELRPGDLVFFNTRNAPNSHVGIYIGDERFIHAPSTRGKVRTESLASGWFAARFEGARSYFD